MVDNNVGYELLANEIENMKDELKILIDKYELLKGKRYTINQMQEIIHHGEIQGKILLLRKNIKKLIRIRDKMIKKKNKNITSPSAPPPPAYND